jgi:pilus assembly protein CpaE
VALCRVIKAGGTMSIKLSIIANEESEVSALAKINFGSEEVDISVHAGSAQSLAGVIAVDKPDVLLLDLTVAYEKAMALIEAALAQAPGTHVVVVSPDRSIEFLTLAMHSGVREILPSPLNEKLVRNIVAKAQGRLNNKARMALPGGHVLAFIPSKGGAGATFLAANLAFALAQLGQRVSILDLNLYFGDTSMYLSDASGTSSMLDLARESQRLDATLLEASMIKVKPLLHVLAAPDSPDGASGISIPGMENVIELARRTYDFVFLDVSGTLDPVSVKALDMADTIFLTLQLDLASLRAAKRMAAVFRALGYSSDKLCVLVNRFEKRSDISLADVVNATELKVGRTIPNSHNACRASLNQGVPLIDLDAANPVARALSEWAQELAPAPAAKPQSSWFHHLFTRTLTP